MSEEIKIESKNKINKKLLIGAAVFIAVALIAILVVFAPKTADAKKIQEQLSLGEKYLSELKYEQAEAAYLAVIEIDPKNVDAYLGLADVYVAQGEHDKAINVLEDALNYINGDASAIIEEKLEEVREEKEQAEIASTLLPTATPLPTAVNTPAPNNTPTPEPIETSTTPVPTVASTPETTDTSRTEEEFWFETETVENKLVVDAENLKVIVENGKTATITISGIEVQDTYVTNLATSDRDMSEYGWEVIMRNASGEYSVSTSNWASNPGQNEEMAIEDMQHTVWYIKDSSSHNIGDAEMTYTEDSITWSFAIEEEYTFDFSKVTSYVVGIYRADNQKHITRRYNSKAPIETETSTPVPTPEATNIPTPKPTATSTPVPTITNTPTPTSTPTPIPVLEISTEHFNWKEEDGAIVITGIKNKEMTEIVIPEQIDGKTVVAIAESAFSGSKVESIQIPDTIKTLGAYAFYNCTSLKNVKLSNSITSILECTFAGCTSLESIVIPEGVTTLEGFPDGWWNGERGVYGCFENCTSLKNVVLPNTLKELWGYVFSGCTSLQEIIIPEGLEILRGGVFSYCINLEEIILPKSLLEISDSEWSDGSPFYHCDSLKNIVIPANVTEVCEIVSCASLTDIYISESVERMGKITDCPNLERITVAEGNLYYKDIQGVLYEKYYDNSLVFVPMSYPETILEVPSGVEEIKSISSRYLEKIVLSDTVEKLSYNCFRGCENLVAIEVAMNNTNFSSENGILYDKDKMILIKIPAKGTYASNYVVDESIIDLGESVFADCSRLTTITISENIVYLDEDMFANCSNLANIIVDEENWAYCSVEGIVYDVAMEQLVMVPQNSPITYLEIPEGVKKVSGVSNCKNLETIIIPESVEGIYNFCIACPALKQVYISEYTSLDGTMGFVSFSECNNLIIITKENSSAHFYAEMFGIPVILE